MKITYDDICKKIDDETQPFCMLKDTGNEYMGNLEGYFYVITKLPINRQTKTLGWKFHIGLDINDMNKEDGRSLNLEKGFDIAYDILVKHKVTNFKVMIPITVYDIASISSEQSSESQKTQINKQITIYASANPEKKPIDWEDIFIEITRAYQENNVKCFSLKNEIHKSERRIPGSDFITYRYDSDKNLKYVPAKKAEDYCSGSECEDPYLDIDLSEVKLQTPQHDL